MSDDLDLSGLKRRTIPEPRIEASMAARRAALDAFDAVQENFATKPQGSAEHPRLSRIVTSMWSTFMNTRLLTGTALATLMIAPIAGLATWQLLQNPNAIPTVIGQLEAKKDAQVPVAVAPPKSEELARNTMIAQDEVAQGAKTESDAVKMAEQTAIAGGNAAVQSAQGQVEMEAPQDLMMDAPAAALPEVGLAAPAPIAKRKLTAEPMVAPLPMPESPAFEPENRDKFPEFKSNSVVAVADQPVSTFSVDVDTSGYSAMRRTLNIGGIPDKASVRIEELVNYFPYGYAGPEKAEDAFKANVTVTPTPWNQNTKLMHIGIKGYDLPQTEQKAANLVFLLDVSGSMDEPDKLPLLKSSFRLLVNKLKPTDTVSIVTYAGDAGIVLEPTKASDKTKILDAIDNLQPGGSTAGEAGIQAAYKLAEQAFVKDGVNRIMLATDGDFNVGAASEEDLKKLVEDKRKSGVFLSVLGFGEGNYQDNLMQTLAQNGNGVAAYIDTLSEAEKVLVQESTASLFTIAKDVKIQVEFNPARVSEYRLIGYETRALANEDFNNDRVDAGDIGSGHTVTAIYEVTPKGAPGQTNDPLRYQIEKETKGDPAGELAFVKIRYKLPNESTSRLVTQPVTDANAVDDIAKASDDVRFGIAVSAFGQKLRDEDSTANYKVEDIETLADSAKGTDAFGYRAEFLKLVRLAKGLMAN